MKRFFCFFVLTWVWAGILQAQTQKVYQIENSDFNAWHTSSGSYQEPNHWHSFESASGSLAAMAGNHIKSTAGRSKGQGNYAAYIFSTSILGIVANGTMTTGRLNAGSMSASDKSNHAFLDITKNDTDAHGDPFYSLLDGCPDSLVVWVRFGQKTPNSYYPTAKVTAIITDGTRYQDPEDQTYTNKVGWTLADSSKVKATEGKWKRLSIPFEYNSAKVGQQRAILVTMSTNSEAGKGSKGDSLVVDDLELVYVHTIALTKNPADGYSYATFCSPHKTYFTDEGDIEAIPLGVKDGAVKMLTSYEQSWNDVIPANTPLLLRSKNGAETVRLSSTLYSNASFTPTQNTLQPGTGEKVSSQDDYFYKLSFDSQKKKLGFYWDAPDGHSITVGEGKAYLRVPVSEGAAKVLLLDDGISDVVLPGRPEPESAPKVFDLQGRRLESAPQRRGIYIVNGRKVLR